MSVTTVNAILMQRFISVGPFSRTMTDHDKLSDQNVYLLPEM